MSYKCLDCDTKFTEPYAILHTDSERDTYHLYCPRCYSSNFILIEESIDSATKRTEE